MLEQPLRNFPIVESDNPVDLINSARRLYKGTISPVGPLPHGENVLRGLDGAGFAIGYISSNLEVRIAAEPSATSYFINFGIVGQLAAIRGNQYATLSPHEATVFNPGDAQELRPTVRGSGLLGLRIDAQLVQKELSALLGRPADAPTRFDLRLHVAPPRANGIALLVQSLVDNLDSGDALFTRAPVQRSLIRTIVTAMLLGHSHTYVDELQGITKSAPPRALRSALAFIEANVAEHISLGDIAKAAGCSVRSIGTAFQRELGTSPMAFLREARLDKVHRDLQTCDDSVSTIAYRWGITHLGRMAADYRSRFHELPSETMSRRGSEGP